MSARRVVVIGAGIVGVCVAYHLSRRGCAVTVVEANPGPAMGVTAHAFGWINLIHGQPERPAAYALLRQAVEEYARLERELPAALQGARRGSLVWEDSAEATAALVAAHRAHGTAIDLVDGATVARLEPHLKSRPPLAAHCQHDIALDPSRLADRLLDAALSCGATARFSETVTAIEVSGSRATGVRTPNGIIAADVVVLAAGTGTALLTKPLGVDAEVEASPVRLLRYATTDRFVRGIVCGPDLEVRQANDGSLVIAEDFSDEEPDQAGRRTLETIARTFHATGNISFVSAVVGLRPIPAGEMPLAGFAGGVDGLYLAVAHPGVILAPLLGRRAAETILGG